MALCADISSTVSTPQLPVNLRAGEDVIVVADPARVRQCLQNLLANAVKHSPKNGAITVVVGREPHEEGEWARVDVIDEGPGVAPEVATQIFDRFFTVQPKAGGLGLGLYLAKRIAAMHGGDLRLESTLDKGSRFMLRLPGAGS